MRYKIKLDNTNEADELLRHFANGNLSVRGRGNRQHTGVENVVINTVTNALSRHRNDENVYINKKIIMTKKTRDTKRKSKKQQLRRREDKTHKR